MVQVGGLAAVGEPDPKTQVVVGELASRIDPVAEQVEGTSLAMSSGRRMVASAPPTRSIGLPRSASITTIRPCGSQVPSIPSSWYSRARSAGSLPSSAAVRPPTLLDRPTDQLRADCLWRGGEVAEGGLGDCLAAVTSAIQASGSPRPAGVVLTPARHRPCRRPPARTEVCYGITSLDACRAGSLSMRDRAVRSRCVWAYRWAWWRPGRTMSLGNSQPPAPAYQNHHDSDTPRHPDQSVLLVYSEYENSSTLSLSNPISGRGRNVKVKAEQAIPVPRAITRARRPPIEPPIDAGRTESCSAARRRELPTPPSAAFQPDLVGCYRGGLDSTYAYDVGISLHLAMSDRGRGTVDVRDPGAQNNAERVAAVAA